MGSLLYKVFDELDNSFSREGFEDGVNEFVRENKYKLKNGESSIWVDDEDIVDNVVKFIVKGDEIIIKFIMDYKD